MGIGSLVSFFMSGTFGKLLIVGAIAVAVTMGFRHINEFSRRGVQIEQLKIARASLRNELTISKQNEQLSKGNVKIVSEHVVLRSVQLEESCKLLEKLDDESIEDPVRTAIDSLTNNGE